MEDFVKSLKNNTDSPYTSKTTTQNQHKIDSSHSCDQSKSLLLTNCFNSDQYHRIDEAHYAQLTASKLPSQPRALLGIVLSLTHSYQKTTCTVETSALLVSIGTEPTTANRRALMNNFRKLEDSGYIEFVKESRTTLEVNLKPVELWPKTNAWSPFLDKGDIYSKVPKGLFNSLYRMSSVISGASQAMYLSVLRLTSLYKRKSSAITKTTLSRMCNLSKASITRATSVLVNLGLIDANQVYSRVIYTPVLDACNETQTSQPSNKNKIFRNVDKSQNQPLAKVAEDPNSDHEDPNSDHEDPNSDTPYNNKYNNKSNYDSLCESEKFECGKPKTKRASKPVCLDKIKSSFTKHHADKIKSLGLSAKLEVKKMFAWYRNNGDRIGCYTSIIDLWLTRAEEYMLNKRSQAKPRCVHYNSKPSKPQANRVDPRDNVRSNRPSQSTIDAAREAVAKWTRKPVTN